MLCPLMPLELSESNQAQVRATSAGSINRLNADARFHSASVASPLMPTRAPILVANYANIGLSTLPGQTAFARPPKGANSPAIDCVKPIKPNFDAQ